MKIELICTGTELLLGTTLNTNASWIGQELQRVGLRVQRQVVVPDGVEIREALAEAVDRADVVIVTGGLGPTSDDVTREMTAEVLGLECIEDEAAMRSLEEFFAKRGRVMAEANRKQAQVPVGAEVLPNGNGTAPGVYVPPRLNGRSLAAVVLLPGPPRELQPMFLMEVLPKLRALGGMELVRESATILKMVGVGESDFQQELDAKLGEIAGLEVGYCAHLGEFDLRLIGDEVAREKGLALVKGRYAREIVSEDGAALAEVVVRNFRERGWRLAAAESCTGGLVSSRITDVAGSSEMFTHGLVVYANEAKRDILGVRVETLEQFGAVSEEVVREMAEGALRVSGGDVAVAVSGIAGPGGGTEEKPVGTVWCAIAVREEGGNRLRAWKRFLPMERKAFKGMVAHEVLNALRLLFEK